jgi:hypothetical protein
MSRIIEPLADDDREEEGCAYLLASNHQIGSAQRCGAAQQSGSPYCPRHHALCHLPHGSRAERVRLREVKALAEAVGGRRGRGGGGPSRNFLDRLEQTVREFL